MMCDIDYVCEYAYAYAYLRDACADYRILSSDICLNI